MVRFKQRYYVCRLKFSHSSSQSVTAQDISKAIRASALCCLGNIGSGNVTMFFKVMIYDPKNKFLVVRNAHFGSREMLSILKNLYIHIEKECIGIDLLHVGGTIKQCYNALSKGVKINGKRTHEWGTTELKRYIDNGLN